MRFLSLPLENPTQPKMDCAAETKTDFPHKVTSDIARGYDIGVTCQRDDPQGWEAQGRAKQVDFVGGVRYIEPDDYLQNRAERWFSSHVSYANPQALGAEEETKILLSWGWG